MNASSIGMTGQEVVINVSGEEASKVSSKPSMEMASPESEKALAINKTPSPEIAKLVCSPNKPPRAPNQNNDGLTQRKSFAKSVYSKPKSRFVEPSSPLNSSKLEETVREQQKLGAGFSFTRGSPSNKSPMSVGSATPSKTAAVTVETDEDEEIYKKVKLNEEKRSKISTLAFLELVFFITVLTALVSSFTVDVVKKHNFWGLEVWKWCVLVMVIFSGMLVTNWFMRVIVFLIESNFLLRRKVLYFVFGLKKSVQVFTWLTLILVTWMLLFRHRSHGVSKILNVITRTLISLLTGSFLWLVKTLLLKILAASFNVNNFFDRIQDSVFHQYVLQTLSGPPLIEEAERVGREPSTGQLTLGEKRGSVKVIDMGKVHKMKREKVSAWTMRVLVEAVRTSGLYTVSNTLDDTTYGERKEENEISSEMEALAAAYYVFRNVAQPFFK